MSFCDLILYPAILATVFSVEPLVFSTYKIMSSVDRDHFTSSIPIWKPFISFSCLIALSRTSRTVLNRSGKSGHLRLFPDFREEDCQPTGIMPPVGALDDSEGRQ